MKRIVSLLCVVGLFLTMLPTALGELAPMTDEEITLVLGTWEISEEPDDAVLKKAVDNFMAAYPNITVEILPMSSGTLTSDLLNMAAAGTLPDLFITTNVPSAVMNGWALDVTDYYDGDPDAAEIMKSYRQTAKIAGRDFAIPAYTYPYVEIVNTTMIERYNLEIPETDWTFDEYCELAEGLAHYEDWNFGTGGHQPYRWYLALMDGVSSYGWDGTQYHFNEDWVDSILLLREWREEHIWEGFDSQEDKVAAIGGTDVWIPGAGVIGLFTDYSWASNSFLKFYGRKTGQNFVIYPQPLGNTDNAMAAVDWCVIAASTEYPREAWELAKWCVWGEKMCMTRVEHYEEIGTNYISRQPVITTQSVWDAFSAHTSDQIKLFDSQRNYICEASYIAPGYAELDAWIAENEIITGIYNGSIDGYAILDELNSVAQGFVDDYYANLILD